MDLALAEALEITEEGISIGVSSLLISIVQFMLCLLPIILIIAYFFYKRRLEHKQILAAIEKGLTLTEIKPPEQTGPQWIKNLTTGIVLLITTAGLAIMMFIAHMGGANMTESRMLACFFICVILFAVGVSRIIRSILLRKSQTTAPAEPQSQPTPTPD